MSRPPDTAAPTPSTVADPAYSPRLATLWAALAYALGTIALGGPALIGKFLVNPGSDQYIAGYAFREFAAHSLRTTGSFPQWNPYLFGGMPYVAAMHGDIFYPTFLLRMFMPTDVAMTWGFMVHVFLAGLFTYLFLRAVGLSFFAALIGGLAYMMAGNIAGLVSPGHDGKLFISALLPMALLLTTRGVRDGRHWAWGALAIVIGLAVLSPHPQLLQYMLLLTGAYALFLAFLSGREVSLPRGDAIKRLAFAGIAVVVGGAMGAIQYLPVREYVPWSPRAGGKGWEHAVSYSMPPEELLNTYLPQFTGMLDAYWGRNGIHLHSEYIGAAVLVLAGLAFGAARSRADRRFLWFWMGALVIATLWALGGFTPFYRIVYAIVPGTKFFRAPSTMLYIVSFCAAILAALGTERALRGDVRRRYLIGWMVAATLIALVGLSGGLTNLAVAIGSELRGADFVRGNAGAVAAGALRSFVFVALTCGVLFGLSTRRLAPRIGAVLLAVAVAADLWSVGRNYWMFSEPASKIFASDATLEFVKADSLPGRVLTIPGQGRDPYLSGDALMSNRVPVVLGYHGNEIGRFDRLAGRDEGFQQIGNPNFWKLMNVRYLLTANPSLGIPGLERVVGPVRNAFGSEVFLYRIEEPNPYAWVAPMIVKSNDDIVLNTVLDPRFDVRRVALFDSSAEATGKSPDTPLPEATNIPVKVTRPAPERISVELGSPAPTGSALLVSENYYPGWSATVDGKEQPVGRANLTLIGIELPAGARKVELSYRNAAYETGKVVTLFALFIGLAMLAGGLVADRRRRV